MKIGDILHYNNHSSDKYLVITSFDKISLYVIDDEQNIGKLVGKSVYYATRCISFEFNNGKTQYVWSKDVPKADKKLFKEIYDMNIFNIKGVRKTNDD